MARPRHPQDGESLRTPIAGFPLFVGERRKPRVIAADVWACIRHLVEEAPRVSANGKRRALAHLTQAHEFFHAADTPHNASRPLLYYYAFLNLAKVFLLTKGRDLPPGMFHGIRDPQENVRTRLRLEGQRIRTDAAAPKTVFPLLMQDLNMAYGKLPPRSYRILDLFAQMPGIHRAYMRVTGACPAFVPIKRTEILTNHNRIWARFTLDAQDRDVWEVLPAARKHFGQALVQVSAPDGERCFEAYEGGEMGGIDNSLGFLAYYLRRVGVAALLTRDGYRYYFGTFPRRVRLPQLCAVYAAMFYLGSITRYKPHDFDRIISGRYAWLVREFLATQPEQFLYLLASTLAGVEVVRPLIQ